MDGRHKKWALVGRARGLFSAGFGMDEIASRFHLSQRSLYRWREEDKAVGISWTALRTEAAAVNPAILVRALEDRLRQALADDALTVGDRAEVVMHLSAALQAERRHLVKVMEGTAK
jgi:hypothetical protein